MNVNQLKKVLVIMGIPDRYYSINSGLKPDSFILRNVYAYWEYFYMDERGGENEYKRFESESEACDFFFTVMKEQSKYF